MSTNANRSVVTGGAGFIGSHLVERLVADGDDVVVVDDLRSGREANLAAVADSVQLVEADIAADPLEDAFAGADRVFHLAGMADIVPSIEQPRRYFEANVVGTFNVLEAARQERVQSLVYTASSTCYGIPEQYPTPESAPIDTRYPYAQTKYQGEELVRHWHKCYGLPTISLRFFNVYGPRSRTSGTYGAVFGVFLAQKIHGEPYTVVGDGEQTRDFTYVTDVVDALVRAANSGLAGEVMNVASGQPQSVNRLVELLGGEVVHVPKRPGEPDCTWADISRVRELLEWEPRVSFEDGVGRMLERIDDWREAPVWTPTAIEKATEAWFEHLSV
jgi:UDP-glucose 4-epimerase